MAVRMAALGRSKNGEFFARKGIPADVREAYARLYNVRWEAQLKLPAHTSKHEAKTRHGEWLAEVENRIATLRAVAKGEGQPLTRLNAIALAGRWYVWFLAQYESAPEVPEHWRKRSDHLIWDILHPEAPDTFHENSQADPEWEWAKHPEVRARVRSRIAEMARVASFLASEGMALDNNAHTLFVDAVSDNLYTALSVLERRARGDYTPDNTPESFPAFTGSRAGNAHGLDCWQLFEVFAKAIKPADNTVKRWRAVFLNLQSEFPHTSAAAITEADARAWAGKLVTPKRSPTTVREVWIPAARRVFSWAEDQKHIRKSPFAAIKVDVPKKARNRETKAFIPEEVRLILSATLKYEKPKSAFERAKRWVMWLCAYSGARAGEMTQLRGIDVQKRGSFHVMKLTPDAGTIKTSEARVVPIHEHLVAQGFMELVREIGKGPLFYNQRQTPASNTDPLNPSRTPAESARARLSDWVRELGVKDPEVSPTHGWRHTFKQTAQRSGIAESVHDTITGHAPPSEGRKYNVPTVEDMAAALKKFPRYQLDGEAGATKRKGESARNRAVKKRTR
jgi:integrase